MFVDALSPYGQWVSHPGYGRVFVPQVASGWRPYTVGHWVHDPRWGRLWRSTEPFGWATSHYGRWGYDSRIGWFWVPDTLFGPHWVQWRGGSSTVGWAALPPRGWERWGVGYNPYAFSGWWVFAPLGYLYDPWLPRHIYRPHPRHWHGTRPVDRPPSPGIASEAVRHRLQQTRAPAPAPPFEQAAQPETVPSLPAADALTRRGRVREGWEAMTPEQQQAARQRWEARREAWQARPEAERAAAREAARARWQARAQAAAPDADAGQPARPAPAQRPMVAATPDAAVPVRAAASPPRVERAPPPRWQADSHSRRQESGALSQEP